MKRLKISVPIAITIPAVIPGLRFPGRQRLFKAARTLKQGIRSIAGLSSERIRIIITHGVYICMDGAIFAWDNIRKNRRKGFFEDLQDAV